MEEIEYNENNEDNQDENVYLINEEERKEKNKLTRLENILKRLHSKISNSNGKTFAEIYEKHYFTQNDLLKREMISGEDAVYKRVKFYCYLLVLGLVSTSAIFHCFSIKNSLYDLLITTVKIYEEIGNENTTDYRPLNFHDYYYNRTYVEALDFNINLISILNIIGSILMSIWGFGISYFFCCIFIIISLLMIYNIGFDEKTLVEHQISLYDILYIFFAYIFIFFGTGCSSLMTQQIIIEYYLKIKKTLKINKILNDPNSLSLNNENDFWKDTKGNSQDMRFIFIFIGLITVFGYYSYGGGAIISLNALEIKNEENPIKYYFYYIVVGVVLSMVSTLLINCNILFEFTYDFCPDVCKSKQVIYDDKISTCKIFGYTIYSETIKNEKYKNKCCKCECCKLFCKSIKNCCDNVICSSFEVFQRNDEPCKCCCCCCCETKEEDFEQNEITFCYIYKSERNMNWFNQFISNKVQKEMVPYVILYFILRLSTFNLEEQYKNNISIYNDIGKFDSYYDLVWIVILFLAYYVIFIYLTYSISNISQYIKKQNAKLSQEKSFLNGIFGILLITSIFSLYSLLKEEEIETKSIIKQNYDILIPLSFIRFFYLAISFYASRNSDIENNNQKVSSSILITLYISVEDFIIFIIKQLCNTNVLFYISISASCISLTICLVLLLLQIIYAILRKDVKFGIYLLYTFTLLGPFSSCLFKRCCDYSQGECFCIGDCDCDRD